jgi:hypothetical protein
VINLEEAKTKLKSDWIVSGYKFASNPEGNDEFVKVGIYDTSCPNDP